MSNFEQPGLSSSDIEKKTAQENRDREKAEYIEFLNSVKQAFLAIKMQTERAEKLLDTANLMTDVDVDFVFAQPSAEELEQAALMRSEAESIKESLPGLVSHASGLLAQLSDRVDALLAKGFKLDKETHLRDAKG